MSAPIILPPMSLSDLGDRFRVVAREETVHGGGHSNYIRVWGWALSADDRNAFHHAVAKGRIIAAQQRQPDGTMALLAKMARAGAAVALQAGAVRKAVGMSMETKTPAWRASPCPN